MKTKQLSVFVENRKGSILEMAKILADNGVNMKAFSLAENADFGILRMIVSDIDLAERVLRTAKFGLSITDVIKLTLPDRPGALAQILEKLATHDIFIEYMYAFSRNGNADIIIRPTNLERCLEVLNS